MSCAACGAEQRPGATFCRGCGVSLASAAARDGTAPLSTAALSVPPTVRRGKRQIALALACYLAMLILPLALVVTVGIDLTSLRALSLGELALVLVALQLVAGDGTQIPTLKSFVTVRAMPARVWATIAGGAALALAAAWALGLAFEMIDAEALLLYREQGHGLGSALLDYSVLAPLIEETAFRGIILGALAGPVGRKGALWASSLMFATIHLSPITFVHHTLLGLVCGYARLESRSLLVPILVHGSYNAVVVLLSW